MSWVSHVNAFTDDWSNYLNWLCPPISSIGFVICHLNFCKAKGTLLVPVCPSSHFLPLIYPDWKQMTNFHKRFNHTLQILFSTDTQNSSPNLFEIFVMTVPQIICMDLEGPLSKTELNVQLHLETQDVYSQTERR